MVIHQDGQLHALHSSPARHKTERAFYIFAVPYEQTRHISRLLQNDPDADTKATPFPLVSPAHTV